ncbi:MAG: hypothetical protein KGJ13_08560 [Patescibacteria group bacterium]|nr:hypothetical protein [Patescibacteria group bacterium]
MSISISLKELNQSYQELKRLCEQDMPKGKGQTARRLSRIKRTADTAIENWNDDQKKIARAHGLIISGVQVRALKEGELVTPEQFEAFELECRGVLESPEEAVTFRGEPFTDAEWSEIEPALNISPEMLNRLVWLIPDSE